MIVWRLCREPYTKLDGEGSRLYGSRWNSKGQAVNYTATALSLGVLEYLVHADPDDLPDDLLAMRIELPDEDYPAIQPQELAHPDEATWYAEKGDVWIRSNQSLALLVPSVIIPEENNVLVNPAHPEMRRVQILSTRRFAFDPRLLIR